MKNLLLISFLLFGSIFSASAGKEVDPEYRNIFSYIEDQKYPVAIEKLNAFHKKGKKEPKSYLLLARLYLLNENHKMAIDAIEKAPESERDVLYWSMKLNMINKYLQNNGKIKEKDRISKTLKNLMKLSPSYDKYSKNNIEILFKNYKDKELFAHYCQDLKKKNGENCGK